MKRFALLAFCAIGMAQADIVPMLVGTGGVNCGVQSGVWGCDYSYTAQLHDSAMLTADQQEHDEYFTIYDFNGYISGSAVAPGPGLWTVSEQNVGVTPSRILMGADDDPAIANVTFEYVGAADVAGGSSLGTFTLRSRFGPDVTGSHFTSQATHRIVSPNSPSWIQNIGHVDVPVPFRSDVEPIPEPMSMALIGSGLAGIGLFRRVRK
jgi:hypothetical protein